MLRVSVSLALAICSIGLGALGASCAAAPAVRRAPRAPAAPAAPTAPTTATAAAAGPGAKAPWLRARHTVSLLDRGMLVAGRRAPAPWRAVDLGGDAGPARVEAGPALAGCRGWGLEIRAHGGATMIARPVGAIAATSSPILSWSWKVDRPVGAARLDRKDGDDAAGRVLVGFRYEPAGASTAERIARALRTGDGGFAPGSSLCYVWSAAEPVGAVLPSPYSDRVRVIVLRSGAAAAGAWVTEQRDVVADYVRAFGRQPPPLEGVAVMADTDQTGASAVACFRDIAVSVREVPPRSAK